MSLTYLLSFVRVHCIVSSVRWFSACEVLSDVASCMITVFVIVISVSVMSASVMLAVCIRCTPTSE